MMFMVAEQGQTPQKDEVFTITEIARMLKVSEQIVRTEINEGKLDHKKIGRQIRVTRTMLDKYLGNE